VIIAKRKLTSHEDAQSTNSQTC